MAVFLGSGAEMFFASPYSSVILVAILTVILMVIIWIGSGPDWVYHAVGWTGFVFGVITAAGVYTARSYGSGALGMLRAVA